MAAKPTRKKVGPKAEVLKIEGGWKDAVKHALGRGKQPGVKKKKGKRK